MRTIYNLGRIAVLLAVVVAAILYSLGYFHKEATITDVTQEIILTQFESQWNSPNTNIVYIGRSTCSDCNLFEPKLIDLLQKNQALKLQYLDAQKLKDNGRWEEFKKQYDVHGTPTILIIQAGNIVASLDYEKKNFSIKDVEALLLK